MVGVGFIQLLLGLFVYVVCGGAVAVTSSYPTRPITSGLPPDESDAGASAAMRTAMIACASGGAVALAAGLYYRGRNSLISRKRQNPLFPDQNIHAEEEQDTIARDVVSKLEPEMFA
eukprot:Protomagalhaensia_wolfi_Nauph_80__1332@NODE_1795_length_1335_cov_515_614198_g1399_i0_p3_GENE_NODE_1795_length_1335_cov_515_614198_g1399_i0NODE_1795_length_1335_cov_515_614198_g1399_i0_p3_ORF_typecomplete_len117_score18_60DUF389/PF04087_14/0_015RAMP4/PF06624_12/0_14FTSW_RODA_SPOVE/PF01098_19/0_095_NODE_1795_length_1335_cov_515_614198_g1399_i0381731